MTAAKKAQAKPQNYTPAEALAKAKIDARKWATPPVKPKTAKTETTEAPAE